MSSLDRIEALAEEIKRKKKKKDSNISEGSLSKVERLAEQIKSGDKNAFTNYMNDIDNTIAPIKTTTSTDDIAPVKEEDQPWYKRILKGSEAFDDNLRRFDDGYNFGDITKTGLETILDTGATIGATTLDVGANLVEGFAGIGQEAARLGATGVAQVVDWAGNDEWAKQIRTNVATLNPITDPINKFQSAVDPYSVSGHYADETAKLVGFTGGMVAGSSVLGGASTIPVTVGKATLRVPTLALVTGAGSAAQESYSNKDIIDDDKWTDDVQAWTNILGGGAIEGISESLFGMFGVGGNEITDQIANKVVGKIGSSAGKILAKMGISATGEAAEEFISYAGNWLLDNGIVDKMGEADFDKEWDWSEVGEQMALAFASAGITQGGGSIVQVQQQTNVAVQEAEKQLGRKLTNEEKTSIKNQVAEYVLHEGNTDNEQAVLDKVVEARFNEEIKSKELSTREQTKLRNKITEEVQADMEKGLVDTDTIESILGGETYTKLQNTKTEIEGIQKQVTELENKPNAEITVKEKELLDSLREKLGTIQTTDIQDQLQTEMSEKIKSDRRLQRSYYEKAQRSKTFTQEITEKTSEIAKVLYESASKTMNNTTRSHDFVESLVKIAEDRGTKYVLVNNEQLKRHYEKTGASMIDGYVNNKGEVIINVDSPKAFIKTVGHETTHLLEGTNEYKVLQDTVREYAELKGEYQTKKESLTKLYEGTAANIENEITSDLVGEYIFNDADFVNHLSTKQPNVFKRVYDYIKHLAKQLTAGSKEARQLEKVKYRFEQAYRTAKKNGQQRTQQNAAEQNAKYSVSEDISNHKQQQLEIVLKENPADDSLSNHTWIRSVEDIKTFEEALQEDLDGEIQSLTPDVSAEMVQKMIETGKAIVYSSYPIKQGTFVTPSKMEAQAYAGSGKVYSKEVDLKDVAWLDTLQGQYAKVEAQDTKYSLSEEIPLEQRLTGDALLDAEDLIYEIEDMAEISPNGYVTLYHRTSKENAANIYKSGKMSAKEDGIFFSTKNTDSQAVGFGDGVVKIKIPVEKLILDDIFSDEAHLKIPLKNKNEVVDVSEYLVTDSYSLSDTNNAAPRQRGQTYSEDVKIQEVISDVDKTINDLFDRLNKISERITVDANEYAPIKQTDLPNLEQQFSESFKTIDDNIAPVEQEIDQLDEENTLDSIKGITLDTKELTKEMLDLGVARKYNTKELKKAAEELNTLISQGMTDEATIDTFVDSLGTRLLVEHDPYQYDDAVQQARDYIRTTRLYVSDAVKSGIGQWNEFRKANMGKMKLTNDPKATPVDSAYQELQEMFGTSLFPDDVYNPADQLEYISEILGTSKSQMSLYDYVSSEYGSKAWEEIKQTFIDNISSKVTEAAKLKEVADYTDYYASMPIDDSYIPEVPKRQDIDDILPVRNEVPEFEEVATQRRMDFDNQVLTDEPVSDLEKKKARALKKLGNKENYIKNKVTDFYQETKKLTKGVRASQDLSRVLDVAFKDIDTITEGMSEEDAKAEKNRIWRDVTNSFMNIKAKPFEIVNPNSKIEVAIRQEIDRQYNAKLQDINNMKEGKPRKVVQEEHRKLARELIGDTSKWIDKNMGIKYQVNTLKRNLRDIVRDSSGKQDIQRADAIYQEYQGKYNENEAKLKAEFNRIAQPFRDLKLTREEETYVQMLGEARYNPDTTLLPDKVEEFYKTNKAKIDVGKVEKAIEGARQTYDELFNRINQTLRNQGMQEIKYRKGYFPHFVEEKQGLLARLFDWKVKNDQIPTDIAGLTELNNPERSWQGFNKHREGDTTDYNFSKGFDTYVHGALDWIYHIEDIQKRRALENEIRYQHSEKGVKEKIEAIYNNEDLDADEVQAQIDAVFSVARNPLNNFVTDLRTGTNQLAGKKSSLDRGMEYATNRKIYSTMTNISNRVSGNMIAGSVSSALTNFIPITQSWVEVSPVSSLNAARETIANAIKDDGTIAKSTFLTNRLIKADNLYKSNWDKAADKVAIMTDIIDSFTSQVVWRAKYNENIKNGMSEMEAINNADIFAENVIAGRSRGNEPTIFHSKNPITKMFTAFQLEVNNQYQYMFKDAPIDIGSKNKLIKGYATAFIGAFIYNALYSSLTGRDAAFDPIGLLEGILKELGFGGDDEEEEKSASEKFTAITEDLVQQLPFVGGLFGGGRVPLSAAIPYENPIAMVKETGADLLNLADGEKREKAFKDLTSEWLKPVTYLALPFGGGQISKTIKGLSMYDEDLPIAGSYTNGGDLRFTADESTTGKIKSAIFGQWASDSAQEYVDSGFKVVNKDDIEELVDLDMTSTEYRKYRKGLKDAGSKNKDKIEYINSLDVPIEHKNIMTNNVLKRDYEVDMTGFTNYEEFDFSYKYPEKYDFLQANSISFEEYNTSKERKEAYDWAYENQESYVVSRAVTDDVLLYRKYKKDLDELKADKNSEGKTISNSLKNKKLDYINNLDIDYGAKIILYKTEYTGADEYNNDIIDYLNNRNDISAEEMTTIVKKLGMEVDEDGNIWWN